MGSPRKYFFLHIEINHRFRLLCYRFWTASTSKLDHPRYTHTSPLHWIRVGVKPQTSIEKKNPMTRFLRDFFLLIIMGTATQSSEAEALTSAGAGNAAGNSASDGDVPQLPPPDPNSNLPTFRLGETIRLEEMGPIILNTDGSTRRIQNWDTLTEGEKEVTWRRISKRNEQRRQILLRQQEEALEKQAREEEDKASEL